MSGVELTNRKSSEELVIFWKIPNFTQLHKTAKTIKNQNVMSQKTSCQFTAGESVSLPCTWKVELEIPTGNEHIGFYLYLMKSPAPVGRIIKARFCPSVKVTDGNSNNLVLSADPTKIDEYKVGSALGYAEFVTMDKLKNFGALHNNDILTLYVKLVIYGDSNTTNPMLCAREILKHNAFNQMSKHFEELLETGEGADFVIRVKKLDTQEYVEKKVSSIILSSQSSVFAVMLGSPMSEKKTGVITIKDLSPKGLDILLEFIYTGNLSDDWKLIPEEIINAAEKYNFLLLKNFIDEWLHTACTTENAFILFTVAKKQRLLKATKNILEYIKSNLENVLTQTELMMAGR